MNPSLQPLPPSLDELTKRMSPRQYRFCIEFLSCHKANEAYRRAYGGRSSNPARQGYKVRHGKAVEAFLSEVRQLEWENRMAEEESQSHERRAHNFWGDVSQGAQNGPQKG